MQRRNEGNHRKKWRELCLYDAIPRGQTSRDFDRDASARDSSKKDGAEIDKQQFWQGRNIKVVFSGRN